MQNGVYQIQHLKTGKCYIGSAAGKGFNIRLLVVDLESKHPI